MQSRHPRTVSQGRWHAHPELEDFLAEVDLLLAPSDLTPDRLAATWPPPARRRPLFAKGVFASRAVLRHR